MPPRDERFLLEDIRPPIDRITNYASRGRNHFMATSETQDAIVRNLEIIGEASKRLAATPEHGRPKCPGLPSQELAIG